MATIFQTTFSNAFSGMKMHEFRLRFHRGLFLRFKLTTFQHWFRLWLGADQATSHYLDQRWLVYWHIYASLGLNELISSVTFLLIRQFYVKWPKRYSDTLGVWEALHSHIQKFSITFPLFFLPEKANTYKFMRWIKPRIIEYFVFCLWDACVFCRNHHWQQTTQTCMFPHPLSGLPLFIITLRLRQNGRFFADDIFRYIFLNENVWISIKISLKFVPNGLINNIPALVQTMAWRRLGNKPLSEAMMVR